jgi:hypothetical protein
VSGNVFQLARAVADGGKKLRPAHDDRAHRNFSPLAGRLRLAQGDLHEIRCRLAHLASF